MTRLSGFIRGAPKMFYVVAVLDLLKNLMPMVHYVTSGTMLHADYETPMKLQMFAVLLSAIVYAAGWVAYGVVSTILIALYDEVVALRANTEDASNA